MVLHPTIHLEIVRQRHRDLLAAAESERIANAFDRAGARPAPWRRPRRAGARDPHSKPEIARHSDVEVGLEV
jgi:hypothetical protein